MSPHGLPFARKGCSLGFWRWIAGEFRIIRMRRSTLDPAFAAAIEHAFRAPEGRRRSVAGAHAELKRIGEILEGHDPRWVSSLSDSIRRETEACLSRFVRPADICNAGKRSLVIQNILAAAEDAAFALMTVWSGYAREAAVRAVTEVPGAFCLALLIYRLNDWVPQVRVATEEKLASLLDDLPDEMIADCYELLFAFGRLGRAGSTGRAIVDRLLNRPGVDKIIRESLLSSPHDRVLRLFRLCLQNGQFDQELERLGTAARHANVRALATRTLLEGQFRWKDRRELASRPVSFAGSRSALARIALEDRSPRVQVAALDYVISNLDRWPDPKEVFVTFATNRSLPLAERALYGLGAIGVDPLVVLRSRLRRPSGPDRTAAILLGRRGNEEDAARLFEAAHQLDGRSRLTCLAAAARLGHSGGINELKHTALNAVDVNIAKAATKALRDSGQRIDANELIHIADRGQEFFDRGLGTFLSRIPALASLIILCRLERAGVDLELDVWFRLLQRRINKGQLTASQYDWDAVAQELSLCPNVRERAKTRLAIYSGRDPGN